MARVSTPIKVCDRCAYGKEQKAVATRRFSIDSTFYRIDLCEQHNKQLDRELGVWSLTAVEDDFVTGVRVPRGEGFFTAEVKERERKGSQLRAEQAPKRPVQSPLLASVPHPPALPEEPAVPHRAQQWVLTPHAEQRRQVRGYSLAEVLMAAEDPEQTYAGEARYGTLSRIHQRGDCAVAVNPVDKVIITVLHRTSERYDPTSHRSHLGRIAQ